MKTLIATVGAALTAITLGAQEAAGTSENLEEEETQIFEAGVDFDFMSAYVWRNAVQNDRMVMQPCVWGDFTMLDPFYFGFSVWQNYDLTKRRRNIYAHHLNETDYNVHLGATAWESDDAEMSLGLELGHDWYTYNGVRNRLEDGSPAEDSYPNTREIYLKATFDNPFVNVYGQASWMYRGFGDYSASMHYEIGFNKEVELVESVALGADWNVNFGDSKYMYFLYGGVSNPYIDDEGEPADDYDEEPKAGLAGTTFKVYLTWSITENFSIGGVVAYTGVLNSDCRDAMDELKGEYAFCGNPATRYPRDFFWGGLQAKFEF